MAQLSDKNVGVIVTSLHLLAILCGQDQQGSRVREGGKREGGRKGEEGGREERGREGGKRATNKQTKKR